MFRVSQRVSLKMFKTQINSEVGISSLSILSPPPCVAFRTVRFLVIILSFGSSSPRMILSCFTQYFLGNGYNKKRVGGYLISLPRVRPFPSSDFFVHLWPDCQVMSAGDVKAKLPFLHFFKLITLPTFFFNP